MLWKLHGEGFSLEMIDEKRIEMRSCDGYHDLLEEMRISRIGAFANVLKVKYLNEATELGRKVDRSVC